MKVAINGVGIAGPTLAYWLRRYGHEPVLFEESRALRSGGYIIDFWGLGHEIAERMGILPELRRKCYEMRTMRLVDGMGRPRATTDLAPMREALGGRFFSIARADLSAALFGACAGVRTHFGVSVAGLEQDEAGVVVTRSDGERERFDVVIGADGLHSHVRALAFGPEREFERFLGCYVAAVRLKGYPHRDELTYVSHTVPGRQVARVSLRDDETLVLFVSRSDWFPEQPARDQLPGALQRVFADLGWEVPAILKALDRAEDIYFDRVSQTFLPRWTSGRVALVGDAAACPSLLAGEGSGLAMIGAYVLAGELHQAGGNVARAGAAYERRLRAFVTKKHRGAVRLRGFFVPRSRLSLGVRDLAVRVLSTRFFGGRLLAASLRDGFELPAYAGGSEGVELS